MICNNNPNNISKYCRDVVDSVVESSQSGWIVLDWGGDKKEI